MNQNMHTRILVRGLRLFLIAALLAVALGAPPVPVAHAADFTVDMLTDESDGECTTDCSLRDAIEVAASGDTIDFSVSGTITLSLGQLSISKNLTIDGSGQTITLSGGGANRVFYVNSGWVLSLTNLTIANGSGEGGGIYNEDTGTLNVHNCTFTGNNVGLSNGGGIYNNSWQGTVNISNSTFSGNSAGGYGGGVYAWDGTVNISNSTFSGNSAGLGGGGVAQQNTAITMKNTIVTNSTGGDCDDGIGTLSGSNNLSDGSCPGTVAAVTNFDTTLADNGGDTQTHALQTGSNAIDNVIDCTYLSSGTNPLFSNGATITADQRGATRPLDGDADSTASCDVGAFELGGIQCGIQAAGEPATYTFFGNVNLKVDGDGTNLDCLRATDIASDHPNATSPLKTGKYWIFSALQNDMSTAASTDFDIDITLPFATADANDKVCRHDGGGTWSCAADSFVANTSVTRNNLSALSDWTVGDNAGPNAITLGDFTARSAGGVNGLALPLALVALGAVGGALLLWARRQKRRKTHVEET